MRIWGTWQLDSVGLGLRISLDICPPSPGCEDEKVHTFPVAWRVLFIPVPAMPIERFVHVFEGLFSGAFGPKT